MVPSSSSADQARIQVEFSGGLEFLFGNEKRHSFEIGDGVSTLGELITHLTRSHITASHDKFVHEGSLRAGILVLINDCDWELEDTVRYKLCPGDEITFISTLHGG